MYIDKVLKKNESYILKDKKNIEMSDDEGGKSKEEKTVTKRVEIMKINVHVTGDEGEKVIAVPCGSGPQTIKWLGHVGIARYDEAEYQGWVKLGVPTKVVNIESGEVLEFADIINTKLKHDDHVEVLCGMFSKEEKDSI